MQPLPDLDALARTFDVRRLRFKLPVALRCTFQRVSLHFLTVIRSAAGRRGDELIRESRRSHMG